MGHLHALHGEIAGLHSSLYPFSEAVNTYTGTLVYGKRGTWAYLVRCDTNGNGGNYCLYCNSNIAPVALTCDFDESGVVGKSAVEFFVRIPLHKLITGAAYTHRFDALTSGGITHCYVNLADDGTLSFASNATQRASIAGVFPAAPNQWPVLTLWIRINDTTGWMRAYKDFDYSTPILEWVGNVYYANGSPPMNTGTVIYRVAQTSSPTTPGIAIDDVKACDITMSYTGGTGSAPSVGQTVTGNNSSSTALISRVDGTAASGTLQLTRLRTVGAVDWNGKQTNDPFLGDTSVSNGAGWSATLVNGGLDPESGLPEDTFYAPVQLPNANGDVDDMTESPVQAAGSEWKVYIYNGSGGSTPLGFGPNAEVSYGYTALTAKQVLVNLDAFPLPAAQISAIRSLAVYSWARKDGAGVDGVKLGAKHGGTLGQGPRMSLGTSYDIFVQHFLKNPSTSSAWTPSELDSVQIGAEFVV